MELVPLGRSSVLVSRAGLGCNAFGMRIDADRSRAVIEAALDAGVTHFDTADIYGDSELILGEVLRGRRDEVVIATKFGRADNASGSPEYVRGALERSLARLQTDHVDLFYYHFPDGMTPLDETLGALDELRREGKIRAVGCSNLTAQELEYVLAGEVRLDALQNELNLVSRDAEHRILPLCIEHGVAFVPHRPLAGGRLARDGTPAAFALGTLLAIPGVTSVIPGATTPEQARENAAAADLRLTAEQLDATRGPAIVAPVTPGMVIRMEDVNNSGHGEFFVGGRARLACSTAVRVLDDRRLVSTNCVGMRMYLVDYDLDSGTYEVRAELPTEFEGREVETDLLDIDERGLIVTSNCEATSVSVYRLGDDAISHVQDLPIRDDEADFCHGVAWVPGQNIVCATCIGGGRNVYFLSAATGEVLHRFGHDEWIPRDVCFLSPERIVVAYSRGYPGGKPDDPQQRVSNLALFALDLEANRHELLGETLIPECQAESCVHHDGLIYLTDQMADTVIVCEVDGDRIEPTLEIPGYSFPHGIDLQPERNLLAVTNYGDNTIVLRRL